MSLSRKSSLAFFCTCAIVISLFFSLAEARAQKWAHITTLPTSMYCCYFFDSTHGVVAGVGSVIWVFNNGAWSSASVPGNENPTYFQTIRQLKPGVLYAISGADHVWRSTDSGVTWTATAVSGSFALDAYLTRDSVLHTTYSGTFAKIDTNIAIVTVDDGTAVQYSTNGGATYNNSAGTTSVGYGAYGDSCRRYFFIAGEDSLVHYSIDSGRTWRTCGPKLGQDNLCGVDGAIVRQAASGVYISPDYGTSWRQIADLNKGSSGDDRNTVFAFGPHAHWIVALHNGEVWMCTYADTVRPNDPVTRPDTLEACPIIRIPATFGPFTRPLQLRVQLTCNGPQTLSPSDTTLSFAIGEVKTIQYRVSPTMATAPTEVDMSVTTIESCRNFNWLHIFHIWTVPSPVHATGLVIQNCTVPRYPIAIGQMAQLKKMRLHMTIDSGWTVQPSDTSFSMPGPVIDTVWLTLKMPQMPYGASLQIHTTDTVSCTTYAWDTAISITVKPQPVTFAYDTVRISACDSARIPIRLNVAWCDTLDIEQLSVAQTSGIMRFESLPHLPLTRNAVDTMWLVYTPRSRTDTTTYSIGISAHYLPSGKRLDTTLRLRAMAQAYATPKVTSAAKLTLKQCEPTLFPVAIKAAGCEDIRIDSMQLDNSGVINESGISRDTILSGSTDTVRLSLQALYPGSRPMRIRVFLSRLGDRVPFDTSISVALTVTGSGAEPFVAAGSSFDFVSATPSEIPILLHAPCDSVTFTECTLTIDNKVQYAFAPTFPIRLQPGESDTLRIQFPSQDLSLTTLIYARIKGRFGGTISTFDTTLTIHVKFTGTQGSVSENGEGGSLAISSLAVKGNRLHFAVSGHNRLSRCDAEIVSLLGNVVAKRAIELSSPETQPEWDLSHLASGEYFLRLACGEASVTYRFVLLR
jgi:hypothetical protein